MDGFTAADLFVVAGSPAWLAAATDAAWSSFIRATDAGAAVLSPWAHAATFLRVPVLEGAVDLLAASVGQPAVNIRFLFALIAAFPLATAFSLIHSRNAKHLFNLASGVVLAQFVFGSDWVHCLVQSSIAYILLTILPTQLGVFRPLFISAVLMTLLTFLHLYRMHTNYLGWALEITGPSMVLFIKISSLAFEMYDGLPAVQARYQAAVAAASATGGAESGRVRMFRTRLARAVVRLPGPLEYFSFVFAPFSFFAGPAFDFAEFLHGSADARTEQLKATKPWRSRLIAAGTKTAAGILCMALSVSLSEYAFSRHLLVHLAAMPLLQRLGSVWLAMELQRFKYYFAWLVSEAAANVAGFGFIEATGGWGGVCSMDIVNFELAPSFSAASKTWNTHTQTWLMRYCYQRLPGSVALFITYMLSAFWHGFYPGYYVTFAFMALVTVAERALHAKVRPRAHALGPAAAAAYDWAGRVVVSATLNYSVMPFLSLSFDAGVAAWAQFWYAGHVGCVVLLLALALVPPPAHGAHHHRHHREKRHEE